MTEKLTYEEFVKQAILKLRTRDYKGISAFYLGLPPIPSESSVG
jgi:hypothetical protein